MEASTSSVGEASGIITRSWADFGWVCLDKCAAAWRCFDRNVGWFIGLDNSKYQWAVVEYQRRKQEVSDF